MLERPSERQRRRSSRRESIGRLVLAAVLLALAFLLGIAFARTLEEDRQRGGVVTSVRTLEPLPQEAPARTVTVTVTVP
jgi:hypothetical protein